jgi:hypothetical protein
MNIQKLKKGAESTYQYMQSVQDKAQAAWQQPPAYGTPMSTAAEKAVTDNVTGQAFRPFAAQQREAQARAEANQRAGNALAVQRAGFAGTPMGAMAGNATEATLLRNRFDNNLGVEVARQEAMRQGADQAMRFDQDKLAQDRAAIENRQLRYGNAGSNLASYIKMRGEELGEIDIAGAKSVADIKTKDPVFVAHAQEWWEAQGFTGEIPLDVLQRQYLSATNPAYTNAVMMAMDDIRKAFPDMSEEEVQAWGRLQEFGVLYYDPKANRVRINEDLLGKYEGIPMSGTEAGAGEGRPPRPSSRTVRGSGDTTGGTTSSNDGSTSAPSRPNSKRF